MSVIGLLCDLWLSESEEGVPDAMVHEHLAILFFPDLPATHLVEICDMSSIETSEKSSKALSPRQP
jgi:hypothetical protein